MKKQLRIGIYILLATLLASVAVAQEPTAPALRSGQKGVITMTTSSKVGEVFNLTVKGSDISIVGLEKKTDSTYTITSQTIKIEGEVQSLKCSENMLTSLTLERCSSLTELICRWNNEITSLDLSSCTALTKLYCPDNLTSLDLSHNTALTELYCPDNLTSLDLSHNTALTEFKCEYLQLSSLDLSHNKALKVFRAEGVSMTKLDFSHNTALEVMVAREGSLKSLTLPKSKTLRVLDYAETEVGHMDVSNYPALEELRCGYNNLTHLDVSNNRRLKILACDGNKLTSLDLSNNPALEVLDCGENPLTSLNVSNLPALTSLDCWGAQLTSLDLSSNPALTELSCDRNQLTSLDLSKQTALEKVWCFENLLTTLELANCPNLTSLDCRNNLLTKLELPSCPNLRSIECYGNLIKANEMTNLVKALPDRNGKTKGWFRVFDSSSSDEKNVCYTYHVNIAKAKGWNVQAEMGMGIGTIDYQGKPTPTYEVTLSANEEGGTILTAGAGPNELKKVSYGTELVVVDQPKEGYELTALTANGNDILATKKVFISSTTTIKATFTKKTFAVTLTKEGEGTITATGASDLKAVAYGTELTIVATPATGYELVSLDANGTDITAKKKVVVKENLTVKATFTKLQKNYVVTLKSNDHGTITIKEQVDLKAVPEGTKLTVVAKGANDKCELTKLTANGEDILKDKTFTVTKDTEVIAEFVDHTGIDAVAADAFVIYPNPASESATVTGLAPEAAVALYTLDGQLITRLAADRSGRLQIDLTALSDGTYLVVTEGVAQRLVVQH